MASVYQCFRSSTCGQPISANPIFKPQDNAKLTFKTSSQLGTSQARWLSEVAPAEEDKISIGPASGRQSEEGEKETGIFYYGPISSTIKKIGELIQRVNLSSLLFLILLNSFEETSTQNGVPKEDQQVSIHIATAKSVYQWIVKPQTISKTNEMFLPGRMTFIYNMSNMISNLMFLLLLAIVFGIFSVQHYGTDKVGWLFAPFVLVWLLLIGGIGVYNIWRFSGRFLRAFSPVYVYRYIRNGKKDSWISLGGILLSITAFSGQAAYLENSLHHSEDVFNRSIPEKIYWSVFVIATLAAIVASQATITATFSIIKQALAHGCFPRVNVVHKQIIRLQQVWHEGLVKI